MSSSFPPRPVARVPLVKASFLAIHVHVTGQEFVIIRLAADRAGMDLSEYVARAALDKVHGVTSEGPTG